LDIAEAYLQIGDVEAAREILEALDGHQDEQVRSRCQALVDRL
jgi:FimV-like protein